MNNKFCTFALILFQIYHTTATAFNLGSLWQKSETEKITKEYQLQNIQTIVLHNTAGSFNIKPWTQQKLSIEATKKGTPQELKNTTISYKTVGHEAHLTTRVPENEKSAQVDYVILVPEDARLKIIQTTGTITVKGVNGAIDASMETGSIDISNASNSVTAKTGTGSIKVKQKSLKANQSIFLETLTGSIVLFLPRETTATIRAKVSTGSIISEHPVLLSLPATKLDTQNWERVKKNIEGTLNGPKGGAPITLDATSGSITIKEA